MNILESVLMGTPIHTQESVQKAISDFREHTNHSFSIDYLASYLSRLGVSLDPQHSLIDTVAWEVRRNEYQKDVVLIEYLGNNIEEIYEPILPLRNLVSAKISIDLKYGYYCFASMLWRTMMTRGPMHLNLFSSDWGIALDFINRARDERIVSIADTGQIRLTDEFLTFTIHAHERIGP